jgi:hypothetical protein
VAEGRHSSPWTHPNEGVSRDGPTLRRGEDLGHPVSGFPDPGEPPIPEAELAQIAEETSQTERRAAEAERELVEWKKVRFMQDRVGEEFAALVLNPAKYGLFVELTDLFVEGLVPIDSLRDDRYTWRENTHEIIGERNGAPLPRRRPGAGDSGPHPGAGAQAAILDCGRGHSADRQASRQVPPESQEERRQPAHRGVPSKPERSWARRAGGAEAFRLSAPHALIKRRLRRRLLFSKVADERQLVALALQSLEQNNNPKHKEPKLKTSRIRSPTQ